MAGAASARGAPRCPGLLAAPTLPPPSCFALPGLTFSPAPSLLAAAVCSQRASLSSCCATPAQPSAESPRCCCVLPEGFPFLPAVPLLPSPAPSLLAAAVCSQRASPFFLLCGINVIESEQHTLRVARRGEESSAEVRRLGAADHERGGRGLSLDATSFLPFRVLPEGQVAPRGALCSEMARVEWGCAGPPGCALRLHAAWACRWCSKPASTRPTALPLLLRGPGLHKGLQVGTEAQAEAEQEEMSREGHLVSAP